MSADIPPSMQQPAAPPPPEGAAAPPPGTQAPIPGQVTVDAAGRRWMWTGAQWQPMGAGGRRNLRWLWTLGIVVVVGIGYAVFHNPSTATISNTKIDSATQIEFDYHASKDCGNLTFTYDFKDSNGNKVDTWNGESSHSVQSGHDYHITASADPNTGQAINSSATGFDVTPTCHDQ